MVLVKPATVVQWHRKGFRLYWRWRSRRLGRPKVSTEIRDLIRQMNLANLAKLAADERITELMTDVQMPGMDGYELAERSRRLRPNLRVLALSGRDPGGKGIPVIRKPFTRAQHAAKMAETTGVC